LPKRGFRRLQKDAARRAEFFALNLSRLDKFAEGTTVDPGSLTAHGLIHQGLKIKILGGGELKARLVVRAHAFSKSARAKIEAAGGQVEIIGVIAGADA
jgi:large subunit ribosomal protein L15